MLMSRRKIFSSPTLPFTWVQPTCYLRSIFFHQLTDTPGCAADFGESKLRSTSPFVELRNARFNLTQRSEHARIKTEYSYVFDLSEFTQIFRSAIPADFVVSDTRYPFESPAEALNVCQILFFPITRRFSHFGRLFVSIQFSPTSVSIYRFSSSNKQFKLC